MIQRFLDIFLVGMGIIILSPLLVAMCIFLKFTGEGEIFFIQQRVGQNGKLFGLFKFVTMIKDSPNIATGTVTVKNDPRILPFGRFLRKTKINELPQLLNILIGHMSIIGPRPQTIRCFESYPAKYQLKITAVRPGLSGIGSIVFRDEEDMLDASVEPNYFYDEVIMPYKGELEAWYVAQRSTRTYINLILLTIWVIVSPKSRIAWKLFSDLPTPPDALNKIVN